MDIQYKPSKPKKEKPVKAPKAPKTDKPMKMGAAQAVKLDKPKKVKESKIKAPKPEKAKSITFGKSEKVQMDKPMKVEKTNKSGIFKKVDPRWIVGGAAVLVAAIVVIVLTVVLPAIEKHGEQIRNITISVTPNKTVYLVGEEVDYDGLRVLVNRNNGETFTVRANKCQITGFDSKEAGAKTITVNYEGFSATFTVNIEEPPKPTPVLLRITLSSLPKTQYKAGEWLDTTGGMILREYVDGSKAEITLVNNYIFGWEDVKGPGNYTLTVKYIENGVLAETTYDITVTE